MKRHGRWIVSAEQRDMRIIEQYVVPPAMHVEPTGFPWPGELRIAAAAKIIRIRIVDGMPRIHSERLGIAASLGLVSAEHEARGHADVAKLHRALAAQA